ncbi:ArsR family transcriptional regulator [Actinomadura sp. KC06]|uniref:arsenate reductase/protein-tyrosine-phosphatase family protein n=1 Tax=Actinomadura sp. KC06 TaxID=2530369 RepID=UPI00104FBB6E|nr:helix-turn-helix domain-containing protein [Actinomadura sp. KC06]TDD27973.1 ArsR family transcriptional regulator [Actinomadura sp. KC06]
MVEASEIERRAAVHAALGEPARLAIVDHLLLGDAAPGELGAALGMRSNLLAHHLRVLAEAGVVDRTRSEADRRRTYVRLAPRALAAVAPAAWVRAVAASRVVFVCTRNSARSQLAAALWAQRSPVPATSAGTRPGPRVHRRAIAVARRHGLALHGRDTRHVHDVVGAGDLVVAVCDNAYEELDPRPRLHWSVPDPIGAGTDTAFETAFTEIASRVDRLTTAVRLRDGD